jgi:hypothetical protein
LSSSPFFLPFFENLHFDMLQPPRLVYKSQLADPHPIDRINIQTIR